MAFSVAMEKEEGLRRGGNDKTGGTKRGAWEWDGCVLVVEGVNV